MLARIFVAPGQAHTASFLTPSPSKAVQESQPALDSTFPAIQICRAGDLPLESPGPAHRLRNLLAEGCGARRLSTNKDEESEKKFTVIRQFAKF